MSWISSRSGKLYTGNTTNQGTTAPSGSWIQKRYSGIVSAGLNQPKPIQVQPVAPVEQITPQQPVQQPKPSLLSRIRKKAWEYDQNVKDNLAVTKEFITGKSQQPDQKPNEYQIGEDTVSYQQISDATSKAVSDIDTRIATIENEIIDKYYDNQKKLRIGIPIIGGDIGTPFDTPESMKMDKESIRRILSSNDYMTGDSESRNKILKVNTQIENQTKELAKERKNLIASKVLYTDILSHDPSDTTFWEGLKDGFTEDPEKLIPFVGSVKQIGDLVEIYKVQNKKANNIPLTKYEESILRREEAKQFENMVNEKGMGYTLGTILVQLPTYSAEFLATGGLYTAGSQAVSKVPLVAKVATKSKFAGKLISGLAGVTTQTTLGFSQSYIAKAMEYAVDKDKGYTFDEGLVVDYAGSQEDLNKALLEQLPKAYAYQWMEVGGERSGEAMTYVQKGLLAKFFKINKVTNVTEAQKLLQKMGWNGVLNEVIEEEITYAGQSQIEGQDYKAIGLTEEGNQRLLLEVLSIGIYASLLKTGELVANKNESAKAEKILKEEAQKQGIPEKDVNDFIEELKMASEQKSGEDTTEKKASDTTSAKNEPVEPLQLKQLKSGVEPVTLYRGLNENRDKSQIPYEEGVTFYTTNKSTAEDYAGFQNDDRIVDLEKRKTELEASVNEKLSPEELARVQQEILDINRKVKEIQIEVNKDPSKLQIKNPKGNIEEIKNPLKNPLVIDANGKTFDKVTEDAIKKAKENGNDGVVINNVVDAIDKKNAKPITTVIVFNKETNKTQEAVEKAGGKGTDTRPKHQVEIENLINEGKISEARKVIEALDDTDPYKKSMMNMIDMLGEDTEGKQTEIKSGVIKPEDVKETKSSITEILYNDYGKEIKTATKKQLLDATEKDDEENNGLEYTEEVSKKFGKNIIDVSLLEQRPALIYGALDKNVYTDGFVLILDETVAKKIRNEVIDKVETSEVKSLLKKGIPFDDATESVKNRTKDQIEQFKDQYPKYQQILPESLDGYVEIEPRALYQGHLVLTGNGKGIMVNPDFYQYMANKFPESRVLMKENEQYTKPIVFVDSNNDIKALVMPINFPTGIDSDFLIEKFGGAKKGGKKSEVSEKPGKKETSKSTVGEDYLNQIIEQIKNGEYESVSDFVSSNIFNKSLPGTLQAVIEERYEGKTLADKLEDLYNKNAIKKELDTEEINKLKESLAEGEMILKTGKFNGKKQTPGQLEAVKRDVNNTRKKLGMDEYQEPVKKSINKKTSKTPFDREAPKKKSINKKIEAKTIKLYRGITNKFDKDYDLTKTDALNGYSTWTDSLKLAKEYAGENGYVYQIELDKKELGEELIDKDGERVLFVNNEKKAGLNNVSGNEYLIYTKHELYNADTIKEIIKPQENDLKNTFLLTIENQLKGTGLEGGSLVYENYTFSEQIIPIKALEKSVIEKSDGLTRSIVDKYEALIKSGKRPYILTKTEDGQLEIVDGSHKYQAYFNLGFKKIPTINAKENLLMDQEQPKGYDVPFDREAPKKKSINKKEKLEGLTDKEFVKQVESILKEKYATGSIEDAKRSFITTDGKIIPIKNEDAHYKILGQGKEGEKYLTRYLENGGIRVIKSNLNGKFPYLAIEINSKPTKEQLNTLNSLPENLNYSYDIRGLGNTISSDATTDNKTDFINALNKYYSINKKKSSSKSKADKGEYADLGEYGKEIRKKFGESYKNIKPIEMPELVRIVKELTSKTPLIKKIRIIGAKGLFSPATMDIVLRPDLFSDSSVANKTLAHELGHLIDYLPDKTMKRGNILGRLATLRGYRKTLLAEFKNSENVILTPEDRKRLRKEARKLTQQEVEEIEEVVVGESPLDPKDVLDIWNDTTAGIRNPDLLEFIAKLSTEQKKEIIKQAMRGNIPAWVNFKKQVKETITRKVIKNSPADVKEAYKKLVKEEIIKRRLFEAEVIRKELINLSQYWKPFDRKVDPSYTAYRDSGEELYADALSVLFNDPALLNEKAPNFMKGFFNYLDEKSDVARVFMELQEILNRDGETILQQRNQMLNEMYEKGEDKNLAIEVEKKQRKTNLWTELRILFDTRNARIYQDVAKVKKLGGKISDEVNPSYLLEEQQYNDAYVKNIIEDLFQGIKTKAEKVTNGWIELGKILQLERSIYERGELANPGGFDPKTAQDTLDYIKSQHTEAEWNLLQEAKNEFRSSMQKVIEMAEKGGYYKPEMIEQMKANKTYATYQVIDYMDAYISPAVHKQVGTFKDISNPATASVMKVISTINAIERNTAKRETIDFFAENYPEEVEKAKTKWNGRYHEIIDKKVPGKELVRIIRDGKVEGYYVDPQIASALNNTTLPFVKLLSKFSRKFLLSDIYRSLFTSINLGFQTYNLTRDFMDTWKKHPDRTLGEAILSFPKIVKGYAKATKPAWARMRGQENDIIKEMENLKILGLNYKTMFDATDDELSQIDRTLSKIGIKASEQEVKGLKNKIANTFNMVIDSLGAFGNFIESLPKVAGYMELKGKMSDKELASFIRTMVGSPNFREKGILTPITNNIFLFSNAIKEGYKSSIRAGFKQEGTRSGYWMKTFLANILPKLIMLAMAYGLFGEKTKKMLGNVSEYDKSNYIIIPLGIDENGKSVILRIPMDETGRLISGMVWKTLNIGNKKDIGFEDLADIFSFYAGQIPSLTPSFTGAGAVMEYLSGRNPYDNFRGRNIISDTAFEAGFKYSAPELLDWLIKNQGLGIVIPGWKPDYLNMTTLEKITNAPVLSNILGRWIKVTDYGTTEQYREIIDEVKQEKAIELMEENQGVQAGYDQYRGSERTDEDYQKTVEEMLYKVYGKSLEEINSSDDKDLKKNAQDTIKKLNTAIIRGKADPEINALISAGTNDAKAELLDAMIEDMSGDEIQKFLTELLDQDIITMDVLQKYQELNK